MKYPGLLKVTGEWEGQESPCHPKTQANWIIVITCVCYLEELSGAVNVQDV